MKKRIWSIWLALVVSLVIVAPALATIITAEVEGVVNSVSVGGRFALDGSVDVGSVMTGSATYDTETPDLDSSDDGGYYVLTTISMTIGNYIFTHDPMSPEPVYFQVCATDNGYLVKSYTPRFDGTILVDGTPRTYDDINWYGAELVLMDLITDEYDFTDALPDLDSWPDFSIFDGRREFKVSFTESGEVGSRGYFGIYGEVTSLTTTTVPEPATVFLLGLGSLALLRNRKA